MKEKISSFHSKTFTTKHSNLVVSWICLENNENIQYLKKGGILC